MFTYISLPSGLRPWPLLGTSPVELEAFRVRSFALLSIAGLARLPQMSLPLATLNNCPLGLSLIAPRGGDLALLRFVAEQLS